MRVYSRATVAGVASTDTQPLRVSAAAGLTAGTVPTMGMGKFSRKVCSAMVEAVLQASTMQSGSKSRDTRLDDRKQARRKRGIALRSVGKARIVGNVENIGLGHGVARGAEHGQAAQP